MSGEGHAGQNWDLSCMTCPLRYWTLSVPDLSGKGVGALSLPLLGQCTQQAWPMKSIDFKGNSMCHAFTRKGILPPSLWSSLILQGGKCLKPADWRKVINRKSSEQKTQEGENLCGG